MNDFSRDLKWSSAAEEDPFIEALCRKAFPNLVSMAKSAGNTAAQHMGIDRWLCLSNGRALLVDFKIRRKFYPDILLEYEGSPGRPGWIEKDLPIDFLISAFSSARIGYVLPWPQLRNVWLENRESWKQLALKKQCGFYHAKAPNPSYVTSSVCVPTEILLNFIRSACVVQV